MKTQKLLGVLLLFLFAFSFGACSDDDEKEGVLDYSQLDGTWEVTVPVLDFDAVERYAFNTQSRTCEALLTGPSIYGTPRHYKYVIDLETNQITLTDEELQKTEVYEVQKLTAKQMNWKNLLHEKEGSDKQLVKKK